MASGPISAQVHGYQLASLAAEISANFAIVEAHDNRSCSPYHTHLRNRIAEANKVLDAISAQVEALAEERG